MTKENEKQLHKEVAQLSATIGFLLAILTEGFDAATDSITAADMMEGMDEICTRYTNSRDADGRD